jgi:pimeloyl-ACP methyl ester carboxylesterase
MTSNVLRQRSKLRPLGLVTVAGAIGLSLLSTASVVAGSAIAEAHGVKPTVVLVHGAFADASGWDGEVERLERDGYPVIAPANPLRGPSNDAAYIASVLDTVTGPIVLVGHSYGGIVITNAAAMTKNQMNIKALAYIAAYIPDVGQEAQDLTPQPGSQFVFPGTSNAEPTVILRPCPRASCQAGSDVYIDPASFRQVFAADLPVKQTALMAATQRPVSLAAFGEPTLAAAWKTIPSWALVATRDNAIGTANVRAMAQHAGAHIIEVDASHAVLVSRPGVVTDLIETAARATNEPIGSTHS